MTPPPPSRLPPSPSPPELPPSTSSPKTPSPHPESSSPAHFELDLNVVGVLLRVRGGFGEPVGGFGKEVTEREAGGVVFGNSTAGLWWCGERFLGGGGGGCLLLLPFGKAAGPQSRDCSGVGGMPAGKGLLGFFDREAGG